MQPLVFYYRPLGPNPSKVLIILEELELPYTSIYFEVEDLKKPEYEAVCINGRVPSLHDPNTGITLWESCAIIQYLVDQYDKNNALTYTTTPEKYLLQQWLHFQSSGQGPYLGQLSWFNKLHHEKLPSAIERYAAEAQRIYSVLDRHLAGREWLVGDKCTYVDLAFFAWSELMDMSIDDRGGRAYAMRGCDNALAWHARMAARPSCRKMLASRAERNVESAGAASWK